MGNGEEAVSGASTEQAEEVSVRRAAGSAARAVPRTRTCGARPRSQRGRAVTEVAPDEAPAGEWISTGAPALFCWRGRLYVVRAVQAHWGGFNGWWRAVPRRRSVAAEAAAEPWGSGPDDETHEVWRVEATAGRSAPVEVVDLAFDWATGRWLLSTVHD